MRRRMVVAALAVVGLLSAACSSTSAGAQAAKNVLTVGAYNGPTIQRNFNPYSPNALTGANGLVYEALFGFNSLQNGQLKPWLVTRYELSNGGRRLTMHLDPRATWSSGAKLTSADVLFTFSYLKKHGLLGFDYTAATAPDPQSVVLTFATPANTILGSVGGTSIIPKSQWQSEDPTKWTDPNPVGSGPYAVQRFSAQQVTFTAQKNYWKGKPKVPTIVFTICGTTTAQQIERHDMQWTACGVPNVGSAFVKKDPEHNHDFNAIYAAYFLGLNLTRKPFNNLHVRRGISLSLDRQEVGDSVKSVGNYPTISPTGLYQKTWSDWIPTAYRSPVQRDTTAALSEFAKAGYRQQGGKLVGPDGKQLKMVISEVASYADGIIYDKDIASQLTKIGIAASIRPEPANAYTTDEQKGSFDALRIAYGYGATPYSIYNGLLATASIKGGRNYVRWSDPTTDGILKKFSTAQTSAAQHRYTEQLEKIMVNQLPLIAITADPAGCIYSTADWTGWPSESDPYALPAPWAGAIDLASTVMSLQPAAGHKG